LPTSPPDDIRVSVPARAEFVHVLRAVTATVASRVPVSFDGIEDLRLAVDEACAQLLALDGPPTMLTLLLRPLPERLEVVVRIDAAAEGWPPPALERTLGWRVLTALVEAVSPDVLGAEPSIRFAKPALEPFVSLDPS
jgi:serine/threonine-protein kinase RsbW